MAVLETMGNAIADGDVGLLPERVRGLASAVMEALDPWAHRRG
jgi:hypothetical protein